MPNSYPAFTNAEVSTVLAALRYAARNLPEFTESTEVDQICEGKQPSAKTIDQLCEAINCACPKETLRKMVALGDVEIGDVIPVIANSHEYPDIVEDARNRCSDGDLEIDEPTIVSIGDDEGGAYVMGWVWGRANG